jgi:hypothetical protein
MIEHPITPPPELVREWATTNGTSYEDLSALCQNIATQAAQWGADTELEACCEYLVRCAQWEPEDVAELRAARRPKPPSLKETLLARVARIPGEGADAAYLRHWVDNESQRLVDLLHEVFKSLPD